MPSFAAQLEESFRRALEYANERAHEYATLEHLLLSLVDNREAAEVMHACNVDLELLRSRLTDYLDNDLDVLVIDQQAEAQPTAGFQRVIHRAVVHVQSSGREDVTGANLIVALFAERESPAVNFLQEQEMTRFDAVNYISHGIAKRPRVQGSEAVSTTAHGSTDNSRLVATFIKLLDEVQRIGKSHRALGENRPSPFAFSLREGRIAAHSAESEPVHPEIAADFYLAIKEKANEARDKYLKSNAPKRLCASIDRLIEVVGQEPPDIPLVLLLILFQSMEADLSYYSRFEGRHEIGEDSLSLLADLASSVEDLMGCYPQLASLEAERLALQLQDKDIPSIMHHMGEIRSAAEHSDVVDKSARDALKFGEDMIRELIESPNAPNFERAAAIQGRAKILGKKLLDYRNFVACLLVQTRSYGVAGSESVRERAAFAALVSAIAHPLTGLGTLVAGFSPLGRKAQALDKGTSSFE